MPYCPGVPGAAGPQAERAAQLVVVPGQHATAAHAADRGRGEHGGGGLVHATLGIGERQHPGRAKLAAHQRDGALQVLVRGGLPPLDPGRGGRCRTEHRLTAWGRRREHRGRTDRRGGPGRRISDRRRNRWRRRRGHRPGGRVEETVRLLLLGVGAALEALRNPSLAARLERVHRRRSGGPRLGCGPVARAAPVQRIDRAPVERVHRPRLGRRRRGSLIERIERPSVQRAHRPARQRLHGRGRRLPDLRLLGLPVLDRSVLDRSVLDRSVLDRSVLDRSVVGSLTGSWLVALLVVLAGRLVGPGAMPGTVEQRPPTRGWFRRPAPAGLGPIHGSSSLGLVNTGLIYPGLIFPARIYPGPSYPGLNHSA
jgi:hypothetical protein